MVLVSGNRIVSSYIHRPCHRPMHADVRLLNLEQLATSSYM